MILLSGWLQLHMEWISHPTHGFISKIEFLGPNKGPNMAATGLLMKRGGMRGGIAVAPELMEFLGISQFGKSRPAPNTVNPLHQSYCPQLSEGHINLIILLYYAKH